MGSFFILYMFHQNISIMLLLYLLHLPSSAFLAILSIGICPSKLHIYIDMCVCFFVGERYNRFHLPTGRNKSHHQIKLYRSQGNAAPDTREVFFYKFRWLPSLAIQVRSSYQFLLLLVSAKKIKFLYQLLFSQRVPTCGSFSKKLFPKCS